ncbi:hypothetical protein, partial [Lyngbya sp. CCY1209]|uniref:hypothetical protein n=1 Tax=Lyngbya sp. CCY1209 TaxID=2886103 RepID=UPI002D206134
NDLYIDVSRFLARLKLLIHERDTCDIIVDNPLGWVTLGLISLFFVISPTLLIEKIKELKVE